MWCGGSRGRAVGGSSGPRRRCGAASSVLALHKIEPARTRAQKRVRAARAAAKSAGAAADAGSSEPQPWGSARGDGGASGAGFGPAAGAHLDERQNIDQRIATAPAKREEGGVRGLEIVEPARAVLGRPGWRPAGHGFARAAGGRVLAAWVAALGRQGAKGGAARLQVGENRLKVARSHRASCAHLAPRVAHVRSYFCARNGAQGGSNGAGAHLGG